MRRPKNLVSIVSGGAFGLAIAASATLLATVGPGSGSPVGHAQQATPTPGSPIRTEDPTPAQIPEQMEVNLLPELTGESILVQQDLGAGYAAVHVIDDETGRSIGYLGTTDDPYLAPVGLEGEDAAYLVAAEVHNTRGVRGEAIPVMTFFHRDGTWNEVRLERPQQEALGMSEDGSYLYSFDEHLRGVLAFDVDGREKVGEAQTEECGPDLAPSGSDTVYTACWRPGEIAQVTVTDNELQVDRAQVFEPGTLLHETFAYAREAGTIFLFTWTDQVIPVDISEWPPAEAEPVSLERDDMSINESAFAVTPDGTRAFVGYTEGEDFEMSATVVVVYATSDWSEVGTIEVPQPPADDEATPQAGQEQEDREVGDMALSADGNTLYILHADGTHLSVFDADSLDLIRTVELEPDVFGEEFEEILVPWLVEGS